MYNDVWLKQRRRELRHNQTEAEKILWKRLRNKQCFGLKFFRQYSVGNYILDFYCPRKHLSIELDGSHHLNQKEYDDERTAFLNTQNIRVLRFWNRAVFENMAGVLEEIERVVI